MAGISLGGWLALDYAIRRPERVENVAVLCPGESGERRLGSFSLPFCSGCLADAAGAS